MDLLTSVRNQLERNGDYSERALESDNQLVKLIYLNSICDEKKIADQLIRPFYEDPRRFAEYVRSFHGNKSLTEPGAAIDQMLSGRVCIITENNPILAVDMLDFKAKSLSEPSNEKVLHGPQHGLSAELRVSLNLLRNAYRKSSFIVENRTVGLPQSTKLSLVYDQDIVSPALLQEMNRRLDDVKLEIVTNIGQLHQKFSKSKWSLFPLYMITERVDRILKNVQDGKVAVLLEGSPFALIAPAVFFDFFVSMDDITEPSLASRFFTTLRYIALTITTLFPSFYVLAVQYAPEMLRPQIALHLAGSRSMVPYPAIIEVMFMLILGEFLVEASIRLPKSVGQAATTVGGLILGEAASQAGFVSHIIIIIMSTVTISSFVIPISMMTTATRVVRYPMVLVTAFFGFVGFILGVLGLIVYLASLRSLGQPYFRLFNRDKIHERQGG
ncbi:spore germination protein [Paenibacillus provencensis]|uniref:Spore germination protein n=1 Tax=Paenibacillus provencensis TaxID=441151 RepID=A0ABW3Q1G2_9BACL|nr:spore germination protein [Paenibacillus sp. MER 78]MCM3129567.1 spore germination protein [Paenibacillus sp. MER 78]